MEAEGKCVKKDSQVSVMGSWWRIRLVPERGGPREKADLMGGKIAGV